MDKILPKSECRFYFNGMTLINNMKDAYQTDSLKYTACYYIDNRLLLKSIEHVKFMGN